MGPGLWIEVGKGRGGFSLPDVLWGLKEISYQPLHNYYYKKFEI
jgi:hypothetical protein